jgi:hypothetical protein
MDPVRAMPPSQTLMAGFHFEAGKPWKLTIETIDVLRAALGEGLLNAFVRCTAMADRLLTLLDCMNLNATHIGVDTVRGERNITTLGLLSTGLIFELSEGLRELRDLDLSSRPSLEGKKRWAELVKFADMEHEDTIRQVRNIMAFHIGEKEIATRGINRLSFEKRRLVVASGDGRSVIEGRNVLGTDVLLAGINIRPPGIPKGTPNSRRAATVEDLDAAMGEASDSHHTAVALLEEIFVDLLRLAGANFEPLSSLVGNEATGIAEEAE